MSHDLIFDPGLYITGLAAVYHRHCVFQCSGLVQLVDGCVWLAVPLSQGRRRLGDWTAVSSAKHGTP